MLDDEAKPNQLYTDDELLQILYGLSNVYWSKNWLGRILYRPWLDALQTVAMIVAGDKLVQQAENQDLLGSIEDFLNR